MEEVAGIKEEFRMMDTGNKGKINIEELKIGLQKLGHQITDAELQTLMESVSPINLKNIFQNKIVLFFLTNVEYNILIFVIN